MSIFQPFWEEVSQCFSTTTRTELPPSSRIGFGLEQTLEGPAWGGGAAHADAARPQAVGAMARQMRAPWLRRGTVVLGPARGLRRVNGNRNLHTCDN